MLSPPTYARVNAVSRPCLWTVVHVPYTVEQDETGWWLAHASLPGGGANGEGQTPEEAVADLREALDGWFAELEYRTN